MPPPIFLASPSRNSTRFETSLTSVQYPDRVEFLEGLAKKIGGGNQLPSLEDIDRLWFELQREMTESGKVVKFTTPVMTTDGKETQMEVARIGLFNIVSDGKYLLYEDGDLAELPRQPEAGRLTGSTSDLLSSSGGFTCSGFL